MWWWREEGEGGGAGEVSGVEWGGAGGFQVVQVLGVFGMFGGKEVVVVGRTCDKEHGCPKAM